MNLYNIDCMYPNANRNIVSKFILSYLQKAYLAKDPPTKKGGSWSLVFIKRLLGHRV